jgi:DNA-binding transcriptional ArsR family regulator
VGQRGETPLVGDLQRFKANYLKAMAHPVRIRVLEVLRQGEASVSNLQAEVGADVANVSQHLGVLRNAGIVTARKLGLNVLYAVRDAEVFTILDALRAVFSQRVDTMQSVLAADEAAEAADAEARGPVQP